MNVKDMWAKVRRCLSCILSNLELDTFGRGLADRKALPSSLGNKKIVTRRSCGTPQRFAAAAHACGTEIWPEALDFLSSLSSTRMQRFLQISMYKALIESGATPRRILDEVKRVRLDPDAATYHSLVVSFAKSSDVPTAKQLLSDMHEKALDPSTVACNALLATDESAMSTFSQMLHWKLRPNVATYSILIRDCGESSIALDLLRGMGIRSVLPNCVTCSAAITACGEWQASMWLFAWMRLQMIQQDAICYNAAITSCEKGKKAEIRALKPVSSVLTEAKRGR